MILKSGTKVQNELKSPEALKEIAPGLLPKFCLSSCPLGSTQYHVAFDCPTEQLYCSDTSCCVNQTNPASIGRRVERKYSNRATKCVYLFILYAVRHTKQFPVSVQKRSSLLTKGVQKTATPFVATQVPALLI